MDCQLICIDTILIYRRNGNETQKLCEAITVCCWCLVIQRAPPALCQTPCPKAFTFSDRVAFALLASVRPRCLYIFSAACIRSSFSHLASKRPSSCCRSQVCATTPFILAKHGHKEQVQLIDDNRHRQWEKLVHRRQQKYA